MKIITGGRVTGKTHQLVTEALKHVDEGAVLFVRDARARDYTVRMAVRILEEQGFSLERARQKALRLVVAIHSRNKVAYRRGPTYIDDSTEVLNYLLGRSSEITLAEQGPMDVKNLSENFRDKFLGEKSSA